MNVSLSETFLEDMFSLPSLLQKKCKEIIVSIKGTDVKNIKEISVPGWRIHKLHSSPFVSFSLDMNYRMLTKIEGGTIYFHRAVKHSLADSPQINRNDKEPTPYGIANPTLNPNDIYSVLSATGISTALIQPFRNIVTEDDFLVALDQVDEQISQFALALYETNGVVIPRSKYVLFQSDDDFQKVLSSPQGKWDIYMHPTQQYIVNLPSDQRIAVSGSAGTGKTVCAWYRLLELAKKGLSVGFVVANKSILSVSQEKLENITQELATDVYFFVPGSAKELIQFAKHVQHIIIDEGQEIAWYDHVAEHLKQTDSGITIFYDINQLGANFGTSDTPRYKKRIVSF